MGFVPTGGLVKHHQMIFDHGGQVLNDVRPVGLNPDSSGVPGGMGILRPNNSSNGGFLHIARRRVGHIGPQKDDGLIEDLGSDAWHQDTVDSTKLDIDLEAKIGQGLG